MDIDQFVLAQHRYLGQIFRGLYIRGRDSGGLQQMPNGRRVRVSVMH